MSDVPCEDQPSPSEEDALPPEALEDVPEGQPIAVPDGEIGSPEPVEQEWEG